MHKVGIIFGKFYPIHTGHIDVIQEAASICEKMYVVVCSSDLRDHDLYLKSQMRNKPTIKDRLRWVQQIFKHQKNIEVLHLNENGIPHYPNGWQEWTKEVERFLKVKNIKPECIFVSEKEDAQEYEKYFLNKIVDKIYLTQKKIPVSATKIRSNPFKYWEYIPKEVRPFFTLTISIVGGESSGKTTMVDKLANHYNTTSAWEYGREFVFDKLGGNEQALQFEDYEKICFGHHNYIEYASKYANKVAIIDTDYVTTQAFCIMYEGQPNKDIDKFIKPNKNNITILLNNNVKWVNDGLRRLGEDQSRKKFNELLQKLYKQYKIQYYYIEDESYLTRYQKVIKIIDKELNKGHENGQ